LFTSLILHEITATFLFQATRQRITVRRSGDPANRRSGVAAHVLIRALCARLQEGFLAFDEPLLTLKYQLIFNHL
jgi:hypothetical protein